MADADPNDIFNFPDRDEYWFEGVHPDIDDPDVPETPVIFDNVGAHGFNAVPLTFFYQHPEGDDYPTGVPHEGPTEVAHENPTEVAHENPTEVVDEDTAEEVEGGDEYNEVYHRFKDMGLDERLLKGILVFGFLRPSGIQQKGMVPFCRGFDVIERAVSSAGRTSNFCAGILQKLEYERDECQALVLTPSCEIAKKIEKVMQELGAYLDVKVHAFIEGTDDRDVARILLMGVHVLVGTPSQILHLSSSFQVLDGIKTVVMDEADEIVSRGFKQQIDDIFALLNPEVQVGVFSATLSSETMEMARKFTKNAICIRMTSDDLTLEGIQHFYVNVEQEILKFDYLCDVLENNEDMDQCVIFVNGSDKVKELTNRMRDEGQIVSSIDEETELPERETIMQQLRSGALKFFITNDDLAYGIDLHLINFIIKYDMPIQQETYVRRVGVSGSLKEKPRIVVNLVVEEDKEKLLEIKNCYNIEMDEVEAIRD